MAERGQGSKVDQKDKFKPGQIVRWSGESWEVSLVFMQMGQVELKRTDSSGKEEKKFVLHNDLLMYNANPDETTVDPEDPSRGAVFFETAGARADRASGEILPALERERQKAAEEIEAQYEEVIRYLDTTFAIFVRYNDNRFPDRGEAITILHEARIVLKKTDFYKEAFLRAYFKEHDEDRLFTTGKFFSFKTDGKIATFELIVKKTGEFDLQAQRGTPEGALAQKIMDADNSGKLEA